MDSVMNKESDASTRTTARCQVKARANAEAEGESEDPMLDRDINDDNQNDSELFLDDDDGEEFNELAAETSSLASSESSGFAWNVQSTITAVRVRPMLPSEKKSGRRIIVDVSLDNDALVTRIVNPTALPPLSKDSASARYTSSKLLMMESAPATNFPEQFSQEFRFDYSYWPFRCLPMQQVAKQSTIYDELGILALQTVLQGHNCSVFAYGQPGAGKTYTMMGSCGERSSFSASARAIDNCAQSVSERRGLIPRVCQGLFAEIDSKKASGHSCSVIMSYVEIHYERVYDLLSKATTKTALKVREHPEDGAFVERARRVHVTSYTQVLDLIDEGNRTRSVSSFHSCRPTRSHSVLIITLTHDTVMDSPPRKSQLCLVDLAGSERVDYSGASNSRLREAASINRSLATLADVVGALAKRKTNRSVDGSTQHQKIFVPYRNSVLTRLLKKSLGGHAKTIMIGAISPCCAHYEESIATLRYIERLRSVYSPGRIHAETSIDTTQKCFDNVNDLHLTLRASNSLLAINYGPLVRQENCVDSESRDHELKNGSSPLAIISQNLVASQECKTTESCIDPRSNLQVEKQHDQTREEQNTALMSRTSVYLLNVVSIRRRCLTLKTFRAFNRWRSHVLIDANVTSNLTVHQYNLETMKDEESKSKLPPSIPSSRKVGYPPLHTRAPNADTQTIDRVQDVVAAVVTTDAICCSVVQDFVFPLATGSPKLSRSNKVATSSLLELLASSSEFDRSYDHIQSEISSPEKNCDIQSGLTLLSDTILVGKEETSMENNKTSYVLPDGHENEDSTALSALSLCVDSIDMARRALGPGMHRLRCQNQDSMRIPSGTGMERELLRYLDKRFVVMSRRLEEVLQSQPLSISSWALSRSNWDALETMVGEFCMQIIARLCGQLSSGSSACVLGRAQLETQLEHFSDRLRQQLLPDIGRSRSGDTGDRYDIDTAVFVATELLVMTERIKFVWNSAGQRARERLLQMQVLEATEFNDRKVAAMVAALEERNAELSARCDAFMVTSGKINGSNSRSLGFDNCKERRRLQGDAQVYLTITQQQLEIQFDENTASKHEDNLGNKLALEVARTRDVQARNDELLCRFATLNRALATASARVTMLETENNRLRLGLPLQNVMTERDIDQDNSMEQLSKQVATLQQELTKTNKERPLLEKQIAEFKCVNLEQNRELQTVKVFLADEKQIRRSVDTNLAQIRTQTHAQITALKEKLSSTESRVIELESASSKCREQVCQLVLAARKTKNAELSASLAQARADYQIIAESERAQHSVAQENLRLRLRKMQSQQEQTDMLAEDFRSKSFALMERASVQGGTISTLERQLCVCDDKLHEVEAQLAAAVNERDGNALLIIQTEEALASSLHREKLLQSQLEVSSARGLEEINLVRGELHESTLEIASLREELTELLNHSMLQSTSIEALKLEQSQALLNVQDLEMERDVLMLRYQTELDAMEKKHKENMQRLEKHMEIERQEFMFVQEHFQRQSSTFSNQLTKQHSIKINYCTTIRDLKSQIEDLLAKLRTLDEEKQNEVSLIRKSAEAKIQKLAKEAQTSEALAHEQRKLACSLTEKLDECRLDFNASTRRWIQSEIQRAVLQVCIQRLNISRIEAKEACTMQSTDIESYQYTEDHCRAFTCGTCNQEQELAVSEQLNSLDDWFNEMIAGNQDAMDAPSTPSTPENTSETKKTLDEDHVARSSLLKTLTDLSALTSELLTVCETTSDAEGQSTKQDAPQSDHEPQHNDACVDTNGLEHPLESLTTNSSPKKTTTSEVVQLRKIVVKLKEALDAKNEMLLFLDGKVRRLELLSA